jgi:hypothetical protein
METGVDIGLTDKQMLTLVPNTTWIGYDELVQRFLRGEGILDIMKPYDCMIILYFTISSSYGHWTCVIHHKGTPNAPEGTLEFFDPYGYTIDGVVKDINPKLKKKMLQRFPTLSYMFLLSGIPVEYNEKQLQSFGDDIATCGYWTALRLQWKHLPLNKFQEVFETIKKHGYDTDQLVYDINAKRVML